MAKTSDALAILGRRLAGDAELRRMVEEETLNARVAQMIYDARTAAGLSQAELAKRIGTQQPAIARLEDADYEGHSLSMLAKVATALGARLEVKIAPKRLDGVSL
jgi:ribosome-binding protein aMBF1 (putative translation factor)